MVTAMASSTSPGSAVPIILASNLETRLPVLVSDYETVASLKKRIQAEHASSFPDMGSISVKAVKIKVLGSFYRMSDSMKVNGVFQRVQGTRVLHIDVVRVASSEGRVSSQKNTESLPFSLVPLSGLSVADGVTEPGFVGKLKAKSKKVNTEANLDDAALRQTGSMNEEKKRLEDNSADEKQILNENPCSCGFVLVTGERNNEASEYGLPLNQGAVDPLYNHDETRQSANQLSDANNVQIKKREFMKYVAQENDLVDGELGDKISSCIAKTKIASPRKMGTRNRQDSQNVAQTTGGIVIQKKAIVSSFDTLLCEVPNSVEDRAKQDTEKELRKHEVKLVLDRIVNAKKQSQATKKISKNPKPISSRLRGLNSDFFLSDNTEATNHVPNEVKMEDASEISTNLCSFISDDRVKLKKGITSPGFSCIEERDGADEILPIQSQEERRNQTAVQRQSLDDLFASYQYKGGGNAYKKVERVVCPLYLKEQKPLAACSSSSGQQNLCSESSFPSLFQPGERVASRHLQQQKCMAAPKTASRTSSGMKCYVVEIDGAERVISPYFDMPKGATFIREAQLANRKSERRASGDSRAIKDHGSKKRGRTNLQKEDHESKQREMRTKPRSQLTATEKKLEAYRRVPVGHDFRPPYSCYHLLQEKHSYDPWRVLVICMMLNVTTGGQVLSDFFTLCPNAETTTKVQVHDIEQVLRSLGLQHVRAKSIKRFTSEFLNSDWTHVTQLHGVGKYAADAYATFCSGKLEGIRPQDHKLNDYWKFVYPEKLDQLAEEPSSIHEVA